MDIGIRKISCKFTRAIDIFESTHPGCIGAWAFDNDAFYGKIIWY